MSTSTSINVNVNANANTNVSYLRRPCTLTLSLSRAVAQRLFSPGALRCPPCEPAASAQAPVALWRFAVPSLKG